MRHPYTYTYTYPLTVSINHHQSAQRAPIEQKTMMCENKNSILFRTSINVDMWSITGLKVKKKYGPHSFGFISKNGYGGPFQHPKTPEKSVS